MKPFQIPHKPLDTSLKKTPINPAKPKPPPPKSKPLVPPSKPVVATGAIEELREELRLLKDAFNVMQVEHRREVARISQALDEEKRHRILLQDEVASLQKHG
uniref:Uncharacterized protein n=1 Tax=Ciona savignyi TaxID=51511 RepID=H2YDA3_CIOSA